ncbi:MAG: ATP-binding protein [Bacteroidales bacterium]|jgi:hypothetical protein|nr:ATP-binding protein [Bacteroidales bacterium]MCK9499402.1 ATP-binding protein [Bacteroidales bacterium]MDY0314563.1 ATP-binding protein [Bacteroidales bacterium]
MAVFFAILKNIDKILERIKQGEGLNLDFKHSINDAKKIARSLSAFANTKGGSLLIGVRDNGSIAGVNSEEEYFMIETAALIYCKPSIEFAVDNFNVLGKQVLEIIVAEAKNKPHLSPDNDGVFRAYLRVNDENIIAPKTLVEVWKRLQKGVKGVKINFDENISFLLKEINQNGSISKSSFVRHTGLKSIVANKILTNLLIMNILDIEITATETKYIFNKNFDFNKHEF